MPDTSTLKREILERGLKSLMDEAKVPMRTHLAIVQKLQEHDKRHKEQILKWASIMKSHSAEVAMHKETKKEYERIIDELQAEVDKHHENLQQVLQTKQGEKGLDGMPGRDGVDGRDADEQAITAKLLDVLPTLIPEPIPGKDAQIDHDEVVKTVILRMKKEKTLDLSDIKGAQKFIKDGISYKVEELMHGGGSSKSSSGTAVYNEVVSGSGTSWTLANTPLSGTLRLFANGQRLTPGAGNDYTLSGTAITTANSYSAGSLLADYSH